MQTFRLDEGDFRGSVKKLVLVIGQGSQSSLDPKSLGTDQRLRDARLANLIQLHGSQIKGRILVPLPWQEAAALRPQMSAINEALDQDEEVVNMALGSLPESVLKREVTVAGARSAYSASGHLQSATLCRENRIVAFRDFISVDRSLLYKSIKITLADNTVELRSKPRRGSPNSSTTSSSG